MIRDTAQQTASITGRHEDWEQYKQLRNEVTAQLRKDKLEWQKSKLDSCENTWDTGSCGRMFLAG